MMMAPAGMATLAASNTPKPAAAINLVIVRMCHSFKLQRRRIQANLREKTLPPTTPALLLYSGLEPRSQMLFRLSSRADFH
jgi:hypothetical protein